MFHDSTSPAAVAVREDFRTRRFRPAYVLAAGAILAALLVVLLAERAVLVPPAEDTAQDIELASERLVAGSLLFAGETSELTLTVEGNAVTPFPSILNLMPGKHTLIFSGDDRFKSEERVVEIHPGQRTEVAPVKLEVLRGLLKLTAGKNMTGARVQLDGKRLQLPAELELATTEPNLLNITRRGYEAVNFRVEFAKGEAERSITLALRPNKKVAGEWSNANTKHLAQAQHRAKRVAAASEKGSLTPAPRLATNLEAGTLNLNSIPPSLVILDGRPLGKTPKIGISVSPGKHSVVFVHRERGRRRASTRVAPGGSRTVSVRFLK